MLVRPHRRQPSRLWGGVPAPCLESPDTQPVSTGTPHLPAPPCERSTQEPELRTHAVRRPDVSSQQGVDNADPSRHQQQKDRPWAVGPERPTNTDEDQRIKPQPEDIFGN